MDVERMKKMLAELEEQKRMAEINMHRADAAIWALKVALGIIPTEEKKESLVSSGDNK